MTLRPVPEKELSRLHCRPEKGRGAHGQTQYGAISGRVIDMDDPVALFEQRRFLHHMTNPRHYSSRTGASWEVNDVASALQFELTKQFHGTTDTTGEGRVFHGPANLNIAALVSEVEYFAPDFDARHIFAKVSRPFHTPTSPFAEQQGIGGQAFRAVNSLTNSVVCQYLPCASFVRRAVAA